MKQCVLCLAIWCILPLSVAQGSPAELKSEAKRDAEQGSVPTGPMVVLNTGGHTASVRKVLFRGNAEIISVSDDKTIRFWDVATGEQTRVLRPPIGTGPQGMLYAAALSADNRMLAAAGYGKLGGKYVPIYLIDVMSGQITQVLRQHKFEVTGLAFSIDGRYLASSSGDEQAIIWDLQSFKAVRILEGHREAVSDVAFSPDGKWVATASYDKTARIWAADTGKSVAVLRGHTDRVQCICWRPDGKVLATGSFDQSVRFWSPEGAAYHGMNNLGARITSVRFTSDSRTMLVTRGYESTVCSVFDVVSGTEKIRFSQHDDTVFDSAFSPDGKIVASAGGHNNEIHLWRTDDGSSLHRLVGRGQAKWGTGWDPAGRLIAWGNDWKQGKIFDGSLELDQCFSVENLDFLPIDPLKPQITRAALSMRPYGTLAQTSPTALTWTFNDKKRVFHGVQQGELIRCASLLHDGSAVMGTSHALYLIPGFQTPVNGSASPLTELVGHSGAIWSVSPSQEGQLLLTSSKDQTLCVWRLKGLGEAKEPRKSAALILSLFFTGRDWIAWTPQGYFASSPGGEALMGWQTNKDLDKMSQFYPASYFRNSLYRPDVIKRILETESVEEALLLANNALDKPAAVAPIDQVIPPLVAITFPNRAELEVDEASIKVEFVAQSTEDHPIKSARLLLDGRPYPDKDGLKVFDPPRSGTIRDSWTVQLEPGRRFLSVQVETQVSKNISDPVSVTFAARGTVATLRPVVDNSTRRVLPTLYVLSIGISEYPGELKLNYAARDATRLAETCQEKCKSLFQRIEIKLLTNKQATRREILQGLTWLRKQMTQNDVAMLFFAGHGAKDVDGTFCLLPVDVDTDDLLSTAVPGDQLKRTLAGIPGRFVVMLDACHAGAVDSQTRRETGGLTDELVRDLVTDDYGVIVMCSSMGREYSLESSQIEHGYFTMALIEGLSGKADYDHDRTVHLSELDLYVTSRVKEATEGKQHPVTARPTSIRSFPISRQDTNVD